MFKQIVYMMLRRFSRNPLFSGILMANLTVGFATFILISQFLNSWLMYDRHNEKFDRIYRVQLFQNQKENIITHTSSITAALSRNDLTRLPEIEKILLMHDVGDNNKNGVFLTADRENQFLIRYGYYADQSVFDIFTFKFISGDPGMALTKPYSVVISKSVADKLFPEGNATGQQIYAENKVLLTVTGVYQDVPARSHWRPAYLLTMKSFADITGWRDYETNYWAYSFYTYVLLKPNADPLAVDGKIHDALKDYRKEHIPYLRPLSALGIRPSFDNDMVIALTLFAFVALLVLVLSSINFINLQTAGAATRFREIGIKKAAGFSKKQLWSQFLSESVILAFSGALLGILVAQLSFDLFNRILGNDIVMPLFSNMRVIWIVLAVAVFTGFISGIHPAYAISRFNPVTALKQKITAEQTNGISLKKVLMTIQFSISVFLLAVGFIIFRQSDYMVNKDMGFDSHHVLFANIITEKKGSFDALRQRIISHPEIIDACQSDYIPFILPGGDELNWEGAVDSEEKVFVRFYNISYDFVPTYNLTMIQGRNFSRDYPADNEKCLVNETTMKVFGWDNIEGKRIKIRDRYYDVAGVIKDYVAFSVHNRLEPHLYRLMRDSIQTDKIYSVRFKPGKEKLAHEIVTSELKSFFSDDAFEVSNIRNRIETENAAVEWRRLMRISLFFAGLSVIISSIGLFGLMLFYTRHKLKEIGLRKVMGFSFGNLYFRMSWDFLRLLFISILLSWPAAYYVYIALPGSNKYPLSAWEFIVATLITLLVALITISYQIVKALKVKPVEILKDE